MNAIPLTIKSFDHVIQPYKNIPMSGLDLPTNSYLNLETNYQEEVRWTPLYIFIITLLKFAYKQASYNFENPQNIHTYIPSIINEDL